MKGRNPKPAALLEVEKGKLYGDQAERAASEPAPAKPIRPTCPGRFSKEEEKEWRYYKRVLENYGLFNIANAPLLELLATNTVHYKQCVKRVNDSSIIVKGPNDGFMYNPYFNAMNKIEGKIQKCLDQLGLSSSSLARIGALVVRGKKQKDEMEDLID